MHNYLACKDINAVVFTYGWHGARKEIYENIKRAIKDGRDEVRINRGMETTYSFYDDYDYPCIDTTDMTPSQVAQKIISLINLNC